MTHVLARRDRLAGVYVHIPFCAKVCPYCDFAVTARKNIPHEAYADAVLQEWRARRDTIQGRDVRTLYLGGGTPSRLSLPALRRIIETILGDLGEGVEEVSLEANPVDVTREAVEAWRAMGITRISLGVQSFSPRVLAALGRNHSRDEALGAISLLHEPGDLEVSADLIYGGPDQSFQEWSEDLQTLREIKGLAHVSAYHLTIEPRTPFARLFERGEMEVVGEDGAVEMLEALEDTCVSMGMERYEISNFGRPASWSKHNTMYWVGGEYLGLGVGAHGFEVARGVVKRRANDRGLKAYLQDPVGSGEVEVLDPLEHLLERLFVNLRTKLGVDWSEIEHQFPGGEQVLSRVRQEFEAWVETGLLVCEGEVYRATGQGWLVADALGGRLARIL